MKILYTQQSRMRLRVIRAFNKFKMQVHSTRAEQNKRVAYILFEKRLLCLARRSPIGSYFSRWSSNVKVMSTIEAHQQQMQSKFQKIQKTVED
jgi:hypothetical protein